MKEKYIKKLVIAVLFEIPMAIIAIGGISAFFYSLFLLILDK